MSIYPGAAQQKREPSFEEGPIGGQRHEPRGRTYRKKGKLSSLLRAEEQSGMCTARIRAKTCKGKLLGSGGGCGRKKPINWEEGSRPEDRRIFHRQEKIQDGEPFSRPRKSRRNIKRRGRGSGTGCGER